MNGHTGGKPLQCSICEKSFTQPACSLTVHSKILSGEKPFRCHTCGKSYRQQSYLNKHIQFHIEDDRSENMAGIVCGTMLTATYHQAEHVTKNLADLLRDVRNRHQDRN